MGGDVDNKGGCEAVPYSACFHISACLQATHVYVRGLIVSGVRFMLIYVTKMPTNRLFYIESNARNNYFVIIKKIFTCHVHAIQQVIK